MWRDRLWLVLCALGYVAACLWPVANFLDVNFAQISIGAYGPMTDVWFLMGTSAVAGILVAALCFMSRARAGQRILTLGTTLIVLAFMSQSLAGGMMAVSGWTYPTAANATVAVLVALLGATWFLTRFEPFRTLAAVMAIVALALPSATLVPNWLEAAARERAESRARESGLVPMAMSGQNAYVIILDGYARADWLARAGHDNTDFLHSMRARGFQIDGDARSNYTSTYVTLTAMLDADYPLDGDSERYTDPSDFYPIPLQRGQTPDVVKAFKGAGYKTIRVSNQWGLCEDEVFDYCYFDGSREMSYPFMSFIEPTILGYYIPLPPSENEEFQPADDALGIHSQRFYEISRKKPFFLFAHSLAPHAPFRFNADCSRRANEPDDQSSPEVARPLYLTMVRCINPQVERLVDRIIENDPEGLIILLSDHGTDFTVDWLKPLEDWTTSQVEERLAILSMVRAPDRCAGMFRDGQGQINIMRSVLSCLQGTDAEWRPERSFLTVYENNPEFGKIREVSRR